MSPVGTLARAELFGALNRGTLEDVARLMTPMTFAPGEEVFRQGERGDRLLVIEGGELEAVLEMPGAQDVRLSSIGPGQVVGELALLGDGMRTATVRALAPTTCWALTRSAFEILRHDVRPAASQVVHAVGSQAVTRLNDLYRRCADEVIGEPPSADHHPANIGEVSLEVNEVDYLSGVLFFRDFNRAEIVDVTRGMPRLAVPRGSVLTPAGDTPAAFWIVARGAVETTMRGEDATHLLRLAGPGRAVGHVGLLGEDASVAHIESRARERSILLEVPWPAVRRLLAGDDAGSRRFAAALWTDVVRALQHGERPLAHRRTQTTVERTGPPASARS